MCSVDRCLRHAQECIQFSNTEDCTMQRATTLMSMARSWTTLANQMLRLQEITAADLSAKTRQEFRTSKVARY
jgi:hypothetical protein